MSQCGGKWYGFLDAVSNTRWVSSCGMTMPTHASSIWLGGMSANSVRMPATASPPTFSRSPGAERVTERGLVGVDVEVDGFGLGHAEQRGPVGDGVLGDLEGALAERVRALDPVDGHDPAGLRLPREPVVEVGDPDLGSELDIGRIVGGDQPPAGDHRRVGEDVPVGRVEPIGQRRRPGRRRVRDHDDRRADRVGAGQQELDPAGGLRDGDRLA